MSLMTLLCIVITNCITAFLTFKGVCLGLRWQIEVKQEQPPTMKPLPNPIAPIVEAIQERQQVKQDEVVKSVFDEWVNGDVKR